jgi:hypothetical protein
VYAAPGAIVPATGALTNRGSRLVPELGSVTRLAPDLRADARQLVVTLSPLTFLPGFTWRLVYVRQSLRDETRGFGGTTAADPRAVEWGRSALDARHVLDGSVTLRAGRVASLALWGRLSSGTPFTPVVAGDVNGDGLPNDRAFVPGAGDGDPATRAGIAALAASAPRRVRACLDREAGRVAERGACEGPWTATANAVLTLNPARLGMQNRTTVWLSLANLPAGLDALVHGGDPARMRGWGQPTPPDPTLLTVRGFDADARRFRYDVNPRFGESWRAGARAPFRVTLEARVELGRVGTRQLLDQTMAPGRTRGAERPTAYQLRQRLGASVVDPVQQLVAVRDSITILTREQRRQMDALQQRLAARQDSVWAPVVDWLVRQPRDYDRAAALARVHEAQLRAFDAVVLAMRELKQVLTPEQIRELPPYMLLAFDERTLLQVRPSLAFFPAF